jgi:preprotein translocase subunit SecG
MTIIIIVTIIVAILLGVVVLIQNPKGGGLSAGFGGVGNQIFGAQRSTDVVEKATWYLAIAVFVLCLGSAWMAKSMAGKVVTQQNQQQSKAAEKTDVEKNFMKYPTPAPGKPAGSR